MIYEAVITYNSDGEEMIEFHEASIKGGWLVLDQRLERPDGTGWVVCIPAHGISRVRLRRASEDGGQ